MVNIILNGVFIFFRIRELTGIAEMWENSTVFTTCKKKHCVVAIGNNQDFSIKKFFK